MNLKVIVEEIEKAAVLIADPFHLPARFFEPLLIAMRTHSKNWEQYDKETQTGADSGIFRYISDYFEFLESDLGQAILDYYARAIKTGKFEQLDESVWENVIRKVAQ